MQRVRSFELLDSMPEGRLSRWSWAASGGGTPTRVGSSDRLGRIFGLWRY